MSDLDVDDIIDDSLYDEDLEEIQIEPDILDYDDSGASSSEERTVPPGNLIAPPPPPKLPQVCSRFVAMVPYDLFHIHCRAIHK